MFCRLIILHFTTYPYCLVQLDIALIDRVARYLSSLHSTQIIVVSLRPQLYEYVPCLTGVYRHGMLEKTVFHHILYNYKFD